MTDLRMLYFMKHSVVPGRNDETAWNSVVPTLKVDSTAVLLLMTAIKLPLMLLSDAVHFAVTTYSSGYFVVPK
jgi:hypothetical protein